MRHGELSFCFVYKSRRALALTVTIQVSKHTENRFIFAVNVLAVSFWLVRNSSLPILLCIRTCIFIRICSAKHTTRAVEVDEGVRQNVCVWKNFAVLVVLLIKPIARLDLRIAIHPPGA